jgi:hypothetical protein
MPEAIRATARALGEAGRTTLAELQASGDDPAHTETANRRRGQTMALRRRDASDWDAAHGGEADPEVFRREILPELQSVSLDAMAEVTGLTKGYCSFIRRGLKVPHQRHWDKLDQLSAEGVPGKRSRERYDA